MRMPHAHQQLGWGAIWLAAFTAITFWCNCAIGQDAEVLLLRGWFGVFSLGLDGLAEDLRLKGINAEVAGHLYWTTAVEHILWERSAGKTGPLALIGHSQGGNNVIDMARRLEPHKVRVDLLVTLAPFMQEPIPANVVRAINYYQSPGWGSPVAPGPGFHGKIVNIDVIGDPTIFHISIDKSARIHADIAREISALSNSK